MQAEGMPVGAQSDRTRRQRRRPVRPRTLVWWFVAARRSHVQTLVCVVGTGGTIASKYDAALGGHTSAATAQDLTAAVPEVLDLADIRTVEHSNVNSALMDTATAFGLGGTLRKVLSDEKSQASW